MTGQFYKAEILNEYVIIGNDAIVKCNIPSFVADFVSVDAWVSNQGDTYRSGQFGTWTLSLLLLLVLRCSSLRDLSSRTFAILCCVESSVVRQEYEAYVEMEHVVLGNDALFKCKIPSYAGDFVSVVGWVDSQGQDYHDSVMRTGQGKDYFTTSV